MPEQAIIDIVNLWFTHYPNFDYRKWIEIFNHHARNSDIRIIVASEHRIIKYHAVIIRSGKKL